MLRVARVHPRRRLPWPAHNLALVNPLGRFVGFAGAGGGSRKPEVPIPQWCFLGCNAASRVGCVHSFGGGRGGGGTYIGFAYRGAGGPWFESRPCQEGPGL